MRGPRAIVVVAVLAAPAGAQGVVSPKGYEDIAGNTRDLSPFGGGQQTVQQIHTDLAKRISVIRQIAFRQGSNFRHGMPRRVELDLLIGDSSFVRRNDCFAKNFVGAPSLAIARRAVDLPDMRLPPKGGFPARFSLVLKFDTPWMYSGKHDLCWQIRVFQNTRNTQQRYNLDSLVVRDHVSAQTVPIGIGCVASGQTQPMTLSGEARTFRVGAKHTISWTVERGPAFARSMLFMGLRGSNRLIPTLCNLLHVDQVVWGFHTFTDPAGGMPMTTFEAPFHPSAVGGTVYAQFFSLDNGRHPMLLPLSATNGASARVPPPPPPPVDIAWHRLFSVGNCASVTNGMGMIVEFR